MKRISTGIYSSINDKIEKVARLKTLIWYQRFFGKIGKRSCIFRPLRLINPHNIFIGDGVRIYSDSRIETIEQWGDIKFSPKVVIGNGTSFEQRLHLTCASKIRIGHDTVVLADVMITDINHVYIEINVNVMKQPLEVKETSIGNNCLIGMGSRIMAGSRLGNHCIVGSNAVVNGEFPDYTVIVGIPAKIVKRYDPGSKQWKKTNNKGEFIDGN